MSVKHRRTPAGPQRLTSLSNPPDKLKLAFAILSSSGVPTGQPRPTRMKTFHLQMEGQADNVEADSETSLFAAMARAGIAWPVSCRNGTCRTCMARLLQGQVRYDIPWPGLSAEEKAEGYCLPCVARPMSDVVIAKA